MKKLNLYISYSISSGANQTIDDIGDSFTSLLNQKETVKTKNTLNKPSIPVIKQNKLTKIVVQTPNNSRKILVTKPIHPSR